MTRTSLDPGVLARLDAAGGVDLLIRLRERFLEDAPSRVLEIQRALKLGDVRGAERAAHQLVSNAGNLAALDLSGLARHVEQRAGLGDLVGACRLAARLDAELAAVVDALIALPMEPTL